jgi:hypothetical protein
MLAFVAGVCDPGLTGFCSWGLRPRSGLTEAGYNQEIERVALMCRVFFLGLVALTAFGCSGNGGFTVVTGTVTYDGKPLTNGYVTLIPDGPGESASGPIDENGHFTLTTFSPKDGVKPGNYKVRIASYKSEAKMDDPTSGKPAIPDKYFDVAKSGLAATIEAKSPQTIELTLPKE